MKKIFLSLLTLASFFAFKEMKANEIRLFQKEDEPTLRAMIAGNEDLLLPGATLEARVLATAKFFGSKNYTTKVYVHEEKPVGFITYQKEVTVSWFLKWLLGSPGCIQLCNIDQEHRRLGIGAVLIKDALADMKSNGFDTVILQTKVANKAARAFYEKHGFKLSTPAADGVEDCFYKLTY
ncbi:hypothetical protein BH09DEP1_BH09DEP1_2740 [soil metagenome]